MFIYKVNITSFIDKNVSQENILEKSIGNHVFSIIGLSFGSSLQEASKNEVHERKLMYLGTIHDNEEIYPYGIIPKGYQTEILEVCSYNGGEDVDNDIVMYFAILEGKQRPNINISHNSHCGDWRDLKYLPKNTIIWSERELKWIRYTK